jgi:hypothetical protein
VPPDVNRLVLSMLEKDARKRPTMAQVREALARLFASAAGRTTPLPYGMAPKESPTSPGSPYGAKTTPDAQLTPSTPHASPYPSQPTPSTPQISPYATPAATMAPTGGKRGVVIGGVVVAVLAIAGGLFVVLGAKNKATSKQSPAPPTEVATNEPAAAPAPTPAPTPAPAPTPTPTTGSAQGSDVAMAEGTGGSATPEATPPDAPKPATVKPDPVKAMGRVSISFEGPPRAVVFIDGKAMGREAAGKASFSVAAGEHTVRVQAKGYKPAEQKVKVGAGSSESVKLTLVKRRTVDSVEDPFAD